MPISVIVASFLNRPVGVNPRIMTDAALGTHEGNARQGNSDAIPTLPVIANGPFHIRSSSAHARLALA